MWLGFCPVGRQFNGGYLIIFCVEDENSHLNVTSPRIVLPGKLPAPLSLAKLPIPVYQVTVSWEGSQRCGKGVLSATQASGWSSSFGDGILGDTPQAQRTESSCLSNRVLHIVLGTPLTLSR